jgi:hypothetical protein
MQYQREIKKRLLIYRVTLSLLLIGSLALVILKVYVYLFFIAAAYLIRDYIFPIYLIIISEAVLVVKRIYLGGLVRRYIIDRNTIIEVTNIDTGVTTTSEIDFENGIFAGSDGTDKKLFELCRIKYLDEAGAEKAIKVPLEAKEINILSE